LTTLHGARGISRPPCSTLIASLALGGGGPAFAPTRRRCYRTCWIDNGSKKETVLAPRLTVL
jgi:hypothetical protein